MIIDLSEEAREYGRHASRAFESAGGDELVQLAEREPARRQELVTPVLDSLGAWDLDPRGSADELEAAAALCRSAGYWAVPYPIAERLNRPREAEADGLLVVAAVAPAAAVAGLELRWQAVSLDGHRYRATATPVAGSARASAFVAPLELEPLAGAGTDDGGRAEVALSLVLPCWTLLGMLDRALDLTRDYVLAREQFGQTLASFQSVQFQLTDAEVERSGLEVLAKYSLWSIQAGRDEAIDDALAVRVAAIEAAATVFRISHQLHGAIGFCDETTLSWVSRYSEPLRQLPLGLSASRDLLARRVSRRGLAGLFG